MAAALTVLGCAGLVLLAACGRLERDCRAVTTRANEFITESEKRRPRPDAVPEDTAREALATAARYEALARDLEAIEVSSSELRVEVDAYRALAQHSASSLRAVAKALTDRDFETARKKRVDLDRAARGEGPLVARINALCGSTAAPASSL